MVNDVDGNASGLDARRCSRAAQVMKSHQRTDFQRDVICLFGLLIDVITLEQAVARVRRAAVERMPCVLCTPNVNFLIAAQSDPAFRASIVHSDLSVPDGRPIVWIARLLGLPIRERVAGSDLFERLRQRDGPQLTVYFFGGDEGVAERASLALNAEEGGLRCVGFDSPGYCSVEEMSTSEHIARINDCNPDFVVVALGAKKGLQWIDRNRADIKAPVISHLGAVINFIAGTVRRAPEWIAKIGLEWMWRVSEEPELWRRYLKDSIMLLRLLVLRAPPLLLERLLHRVSPADLTLARLEIGSGDQPVIRLNGVWTRGNIAILRNALASNAECDLDLSGVKHLDSGCAALVMLAVGYSKQGLHSTNVLRASRAATRALLRHGALREGA